MLGLLHPLIADSERLIHYIDLMMLLDSIECETRQEQAGNRRAKVANHAPTVLLADDQEEILRTTAEMLGHDFEIVGLAKDGTQVLDLLVERSPDVLVLDIFMPILNGIETAKCLRASGYATKVLFLTVHEDPDFVETAISVGALGYVLKPHLATDLVPAIRSVLEGRRYISPCMHWS